MNSIDTQAQATLLHRRQMLHRLFKANTDEERHIHEVVLPDWPDRAVAEETVTVLTRLTDSERRELSEINAALDRIAQGHYGRCEACHGPIGRQRLRAIPEARFCISCTEQREHVA